MPAALPEAELQEAVERMPDLWQDFRGATVLMTGGTGFIGAWMVAVLRCASARFGLGARLALLTRDPAAPRLAGLAGQPDVVLLGGDVRSPLPWDGPATHLVHAATDASAKLNAEQPGVMLDTIVDGTRQALAAAARLRPRRLLYLSSGAVYGRQAPGTLVDEDCRTGPDPLAPGSAYAEGKRLGELLCAQHGREAGAPHTTIARAFAFVGPLLPLDAHFAIGNFLRDGLAGGPIALRGDGTAVRSYLYAADLAVWLWAVMVRGGHLRAYNVGSDEGLDLRTVAGRVAARCPRTPAVAVHGRPDGRPPDTYVPSIARARQELGLAVWTPLDTAIDRTLAWHCRPGGTGQHRGV